MAKEKERARNNKIKNQPILVVTYSMIFVFVAMIAYVIYFMEIEAETVIANSRNVRHDTFAHEVEKGDIITSDGVVIASSSTDEDGNTVRIYPYNNTFAHVTGYDKYGKDGIELQGNFYMLRSNINIFENLVKDLSEEKKRGDNVITTIDFDLQTAAYNAMGYCEGAVIAIEPSSGKIKVMLSKPDYNPNDIDHVWSYLQTQEGSGSTILLNRATNGLYAPGSTFKVLTMLEFIRENPDLYQDYTFDCYGNQIFSGVDIHCNDDTNHYTESLKDSLAYSCNVSFANIGTYLDYEKFNASMEELLFNNSLPYEGDYVRSSFDIDGDSRPDELPQTVIGQGNTQITPLHNAMIMSAIANGGVLMEPYLMERVENDNGGTIKKFKSKSYGSLMTDKEAEILTEYMSAVCEYGTASNYFYDASYDVAGKTGTAEYDNEGNCNSWFVGFSNPDNPDLVVCVIVEDYNTYGVSGTWVARQIFDAYYNNK